MFGRQPVEVPDLDAAGEDHLDAALAGQGAFAAEIADGLREGRAIAARFEFEELPVGAALLLQVRVVYDAAPA